MTQRKPRWRATYKRNGWVLAICVKCRRPNYVEPHGTTAKCICSGEWVEHESIPVGSTNEMRTMAYV